MPQSRDALQQLYFGAWFIIHLDVIDAHVFGEAAERFALAASDSE